MRKTAWKIECDFCSRIVKRDTHKYQAQGTENWFYYEEHLLEEAKKQGFKCIGGEGKRWVCGKCYKTMADKSDSKEDK